MTLQELRKTKQIGPVEVARRMGMTYHGVRRIERTGETLTSTLEAYATAIGADIDEVWQAAKDTRKNADYVNN